MIRIIQLLQSLLLSITAYMGFVCGCVLSFKGQTQDAISVFCTSTVLLFFANLDKFKYFKMGSLEAELENKISEADDVLKKLKAITLLFSGIYYSVVSRVGRWGTAYSIRERVDLFNQIEKELRELNISDKLIESQKADVHKFNLVDMRGSVANDVFKVIDLNLNSPNIQALTNQEQREVHNKKNLLIQSIHDLNSIEKGFSEKLKEILHNTQLIGEDEKKSLLNNIAEKLEEIDFYEKNRVFKTDRSLNLFE